MKPHNRKIKVYPLSGPRRMVHYGRGEGKDFKGSTKFARRIVANG
jgi:hypothetical protein